MTLFHRRYVPLAVAIFVLALVGGTALRWLGVYTENIEYAMLRTGENAIALAEYDKYDGVFAMVLEDIFGDAAPNYANIQETSLASLIDLGTLLNVKARFIEKGEKFVEADLSEMKMRLYQNGNIINEYSILSKGREGSWWETPAGIYSVGIKNENHFSSIGGVYMPWSVQFQGNFFIHGWPYYPDGTPVREGYSGGCIRLADEDAKSIFEAIDAGTPILVIEKDFSGDDFAYTISPPQVSAPAYLVADLKNGYVFAEKQSDKVMPIASLTKLMTALVATEHIHLEREIKFTSDMQTNVGHDSGLTEGMEITAFDLLYPMLMESSNDAARAMSYFLGRNYFINLMNKKADSLDMQNTDFADASGIDDNNVSTARDLYKLSQYLLNNRKFILDITRGEEFAVFNRKYFDGLKNFNKFESRSDFIGGKVGYTEAARETFIALLNLQAAGGDVRPIVIILLRSNDRVADAEEILEWLESVYDLS